MTPASKWPALKSASMAAQIFSHPATDPGIDAAVGDDLDVAIGQQQIDQDAVVVGGVPDPQLRKDIQRTLSRRLIAEQWRAIQRALDDKAHLAGMRGLACLDRAFDGAQCGGRKHAPHPPGVVQGDACRCA